MTNPPAGHLERADGEEERPRVLVHRRFVTEERTGLIMGRDPEIDMRTVAPSGGVRTPARSSSRGPWIED
jgi:hypothetical protein